MPVRPGSRVGLTQIFRQQGIQWGDKVNDHALWIDGDALHFDGRIVSKTGPVFDVRAFGAVGEVTGDDAEQIQAACDAAAAAGGGDVVLTNPTYPVGTRILVTGQSVRVRGVAPGGVTLKATTVGMTVLQFGGVSGGYYVNHCRVEDLTIDADGKAAIGLLLENTHYQRVSHVQVTGCTSWGLQVGGESYGDLLETVTVLSNANGIMVAPSGGGAVQKLTFLNCSSRLNTTKNVFLNGAESTNFFGGEIQSAVYGLQVTGCTDICLVGVQFEQNTTAEIDLAKDSASSSTYAVRGMLIQGCWFYGTNGAGPYAIQSNGSREVLISRCSFERHPSGAINFTNAGVTGEVNVDNELGPGCRFETAPAIAARDGLRVSIGNTVSEPPVMVGPAYEAAAYDNTAGTATTVVERHVARGTVATGGGTAAVFSHTAVRGAYELFYSVTHAGNNYVWRKAYIVVYGATAGSAALTSADTANDGSGDCVASVAIAGGTLTITLTNNNGAANLYRASLTRIRES